MVLRSNFVAFFHLIVIFHHGIAVHYDFMHIAPKELQLRKFSFGGRFIYLYVWNMFLQLFYFLLALTNDFIDSTDISTSHSTRFTKFKDFLFTSIVFPTAFDVGVMFWIFYFINPDLVMSSVIHELVPEWFSHMLRTNVVIFVLFELFLTYRKYSSHFYGIFGIVTFVLVYILWTFVVYIRTNEWIYPVMEKFNWPQRIGFFGLNIFVPITFYFVGELLNDVLWSSKIDEPKHTELTSQSDNSERSSKITRITEV